MVTEICIIVYAKQLPSKLGLTVSELGASVERALLFLVVPANISDWFSWKILGSRTGLAGNPKSFG